MTADQNAAVHRLLRSSHEIFRALDVQDQHFDEDVSSSIQLIERASVIVNDLFNKTNDLERSVCDLNEELTACRALHDDTAQRLTVAEEAIRSQTDRADRAERLLSASYAKVKSLEQRNQNVTAQIERMVGVVSKSLSIASLPTHVAPDTQPMKIAV